MKGNLSGTEVAELSLQENLLFHETSVPDNFISRREGQQKQTSLPGSA
ncbi:hypothetical protein GCM10017783_24340 [Deinococcus piscis]|uniref:Uncharacterized protein n=1 Tax=Deinococcus piscis TaxID=394230 RepID=A0ABQ3KDN7_9DEIO|nr:hypothetical protein GCM10017783_24340 [Deinococcus piscis]